LATTAAFDILFGTRIRPRSSVRLARAAPPTHDLRHMYPRTLRQPRTSYVERSRDRYEPLQGGLLFRRRPQLTILPVEGGVNEPPKSAVTRHVRAVPVSVICKFFPPSILRPPTPKASFVVRGRQAPDGERFAGAVEKETGAGGHPLARFGCRALGRRGYQPYAASLASIASARRGPRPCYIFFD